MSAFIVGQKTMSNPIKYILFDLGGGLVELNGMPYIRKLFPEMPDCFPGQPERHPPTPFRDVPLGQVRSEVPSPHQQHPCTEPDSPNSPFAPEQTEFEPDPDMR